jgi:hypothetical protein
MQTSKRCRRRARLGSVRVRRCAVHVAHHSEVRKSNKRRPICMTSAAPVTQVGDLAEARPISLGLGKPWRGPWAIPPLTRPV